MIYKNLSLTEKTFHGVKFKPGECHQVDGYINDDAFVLLPSMPDNTPKSNEKSFENKSKSKIETQGGGSNGSDIN